MFKKYLKKAFFFASWGFFILSSHAQTPVVIFSEDFSSSSGTTAPTGWVSQVTFGVAANVWRFDNPLPRTITGGNPGFDNQFAIFDYQYYGTTGNSNTRLISPVFDASTPGTYVLEFDNQKSGINGTIWGFDGSMWRTIATMPSSEGLPNATRKSILIPANTIGAGSSTNAQIDFRCGANGSGVFWAIDNIAVKRLPDCLSAPVETAVANVSTACSTTDIHLSVANTNLPSLGNVTYRWQVSIDGGNVWNFISASSLYPETTFLGQTNASEYRLVTYCGTADSSLSNNVSVAQFPISACYCIPDNSNGCTNFLITNIALGVMTNNSGTVCPVQPLTPGYVDYTTLVTPAVLMQGSSDSLRIAVGSGGPSAVIVFVDNGIFDLGTNEVVGFTGLDIPASTTDTIVVTIPVNAPLGLHRMRIRLIESGWDMGEYLSDCYDDGQGETEDYMIEIVAPGTPCAGGVLPSSIPVTYTWDTLCTPGGTNILDIASPLPPAIGYAYSWEHSTNGGTSWAAVGVPKNISKDTVTTNVSSLYRLNILCNGASLGYSDTLNVTVIDPYIISVVDSTRCGTGTVTLFATSSIPGSTLHWVDFGGSGVGTGDSLITPTIASDAIFYVYPTYQGCTGYSVSLTAYVIPSPDVISTSISSSLICVGDTTHMAASSSNPNMFYSWSPGGLVGSSQTVSPALSTTYWVVGTDVLTNCTTVEPVVVNVDSISNPYLLTISPDTVCGGDPVQLSLLNLIKVSDPSMEYTTASSAPSPFYTVFSGAKHQYLIAASELSSFGFVSGSTIYGLAFEFENSSFSNFPDFSLKIGQTNTSSLTHTFETGLTTVFAPQGGYTPSEGVQLLDFSSPFIWDGVSNIVIETCWSSNTGVSASVNMKFESTFYNSYAYFLGGSGSNPCGQPATQGLSASIGGNRPLVRFLTDALVPSVNYQWNLGTIAQNSSTIYPPSNYTSSYSTVAYTLEVTNANGCKNTSNIDLVLNPSPKSIIVSPMQALCTNDLDGFHLDGSTSLNAVSYTWYPDSTNGPTYHIDQPGMYYLETVNSFGCSDLDSLQINTITPIAPFIFQTKTDTGYVLDAGVGFTDYLWNTTATTQVIEVSANGVYSVTVIDVNGCVSTSQPVTISGISVNEIMKELDINLYPNPSSGIFTMSIHNLVSESLLVEIMDINGRILTQNKYDNVNQHFSNVFDLSNVPAGVYLIRTVTSKGASIHRMIIHR